VENRNEFGQHSQDMTTIILLTLSNIFMTFAWYGHLRYRSAPIFKVIVVSWLIAFAEYCFQVPANRIGSYEFSTAQLKTIQEAITLVVFSVFSVLYLKEDLRWNYFVGFAMMVGAVFVIFKKCDFVESGRELHSEDDMRLLVVCLEAQWQVAGGRVTGPGGPGQKVAITFRALQLESLDPRSLSGAASRLPRWHTSAR
jgi:uncharacterized protein